MLERLTLWVEMVLANPLRNKITGVIALIAPLYFLNTLYDAWFGPDDIFLGLKSQSTVWLVMTVVDFVGFLTTLPARKDGRIIQIVMFAWTVEMLAIWLATVIR